MLKTLITVDFIFQEYLMNCKFKRTAFIRNRIFKNINIFIVTFWLISINAFLQNKSFNFFKKTDSNSSSIQYK